MLVESLFAQAAKQPTDIAITDDRGSMTWQQLAAAVTGLSMYLAQQTTKPRVGILLPASAGFVASFYGTLLAGKTAVPLNFLLGEREIAHCIADSGVDTIVTMPLLAAKLKDAPLKIVDITALPTPPAGALGAPKFPQQLPSDVATILYTSGTSGLPKGVMLSHATLQGDVDAAIEHAQLKGQHKFLGIIPLFHSTGMLATMIAPIRLGASMVYIARFSPVATINAIRDHKISVMAAVPSMYGALCRLKEAGPADVESLYAPLSGGEPLPAAIREAFAAKFNKQILEGYGLTETCGPIAVNVPHAAKPGSVGKPIPGVEVRIMNDDNQPTTGDEPGEVWIKGPPVMNGYLNNAEATAAALTADGFFKSGDLGKVDSDGYLHITGRKKELIIVAGEKLFPRELEDAIMTLPTVAEAAAIGKKDDMRGEVPVAFVVAKEGQTVTAEQVRDAARSQGLAQWKLPKEVFVVAELPKSPTGKVLKRVLAEKLNAPA
ncbi:MAG TPA: AMP-binding protein [Tepidisphaeraceae bacterium]|jgi:long-chain acyl-CoA synthetase|nr:AMP-binding protein [Tepidisphaeraceae bacterium]